jgi:hypothetical protein
MATTPFTVTEQALSDMNTSLRRRIAELEGRKAETDEGGPTKEPKPTPLPGYTDTSSGDDDMEIDEKTGELRPKKKKAKAPNDDDAPNDDRDAPDKAIPADAKAFALMICNSGLRARGRPPLSRLAQDEEILPGGVVPLDPEEFAKCVINSARKARAQSPLAPGEFISLRELRGGR